MSLFKKIAKGALIGAGTVLSLFNPAIGAPLMVAGSAVNTGGSGSSNDKLSGYMTNLTTGQNMAAGMVAGGNVGSWLDRAILTFQKNPVPWIIGIVLAWQLFPVLTGKKRRR